MKKTALITGATSGLGKAYATAYAKRGYNLILTGRRRTLIEALARELSKCYQVKVTVCLVDFADDLAFNQFINFIEESLPIHALINNAGYGLDQSFIKGNFTDQEAMVKVHVLASIKLAHLVANKLKETHQKGNIINVCSLASYIPLPSSAMYCSTKSFLVNFSQSLAMELKPYGIKVQALCPGFVHTDFHNKLDIPKQHCQTKGIVTWMPAEEVVKHSLYALHDEWQVICIPGGWNQFTYQVLKFIPRKLYYKSVLEYAPFIVSKLK